MPNLHQKEYKRYMQILSKQITRVLVTAVLDSPIK